jgi:hypothetical protein
MDLTQILIAVSLLAIATAIVVCTVYLISLIKELKKTIISATAILDDTHRITTSIAKPVSSFSDFLLGFKNGFQLFNSFFKKEEK